MYGFFDVLRNMEHLQGKCLNKIYSVCKFKCCDMGVLVPCAGREIYYLVAGFLCCKWFHSFYILLSALLFGVCYY